jgi:hypothetical protein
MTESEAPCHSPGIGKRETRLLKLTSDRPFAEPETAARRLLEHAHAFEPIQDGRIYIEKINGPFLYVDRGSPAEYSVGLKFAIERGWLEILRLRNLREVYGGRRRSICLMAKGTALCEAKVASRDRAGKVLK